MQELQQRAEYLSGVAEEKGYLTWDNQQEARTLYSAIEEKIQAGEEGSYTDMTSEVAERAMLTKQVTGRLLGQSYETNKREGRSMYKR